MISKVGGRIIIIIIIIIRRKARGLSIWKWKDLIIIAKHIALDLLNISVIMFDQPYITVLEILAKSVVTTLIKSYLMTAV